MGFQDAIQQPAIDRLFEECAKSWGLERGAVLTVLVTLDSPPLTASCEMLSRTFMRRFEQRTAACGPIRTIYRDGDPGEGYGLLFVLKPPSGIERVILEKIIVDCWDHCPDRIASFAIEEEDGWFAASIEFAPRAR